MTTTPKHPTPTMTPVKSSQLTKVGYDEATRTLAVEFKGGAVYRIARRAPERRSAGNTGGQRHEEGADCRTRGL